VFTDTLRRTHGLRRRIEETKNRRRALEHRTGWRQCASRSRDMASAATRFARQAVQEPQIQAALDPWAVCICRSWTACMPAKGRRRRMRTTASYLRIFAF